LSCIIPDDGLGIKAETLDFDETGLFQLLMTNLSMVGTMSNNSYTSNDKCELTHNNQLQSQAPSWYSD